jgi:hypothetical protein
MGVGIANSVTESLQATIQHEVWASQTSRGEQTYAAAVPRKAIVSTKARTFRRRDGEVVTQIARITFLEPILIGPRDRITLPDGKTGPLLDAGGFVDPDAAAAYVTVVAIGGGAS